MSRAPPPQPSPPPHRLTESQLRSLPPLLSLRQLVPTSVSTPDRENDAQSGRFLPPGAGFPPRAGGRRARAADPSGDPLGRPAGIPELDPECACGRGGEGRRGEFPLPGGRAAAAAGSAPRRQPRTPASPAPARSPHARQQRVPPPGSPAQSPSGSGRGRAEKPGPAASRHFQVAQPEAQSEEKKRQKDAGEGVPTLPCTPPRPARPLLVVAEDLVGDFAVENFLVRPQVRGRLLSLKRLSV